MPNILLFQDNFSDITAGQAVNFTGRSPDSVGSGTYTWGALNTAGSVIKGADGYLTATVAVTESDINGPALTSDYVIRVKSKYDQDPRTSSIVLEFGLYDTASGAIRLWCEARSRADVNFYDMAIKRAGATISAATVISEGTNVTGGTNPSVGEVDFFLKRTGTAHWCGYNVGRGDTTLFEVDSTAYSGLTGAPFVRFGNSGWHIKSVELWDSTTTGFIYPGTYDPIADPRTATNLARHFDLGQEILNSDPGSAGWMKLASGQAGAWSAYAVTATGAYTQAIATQPGSNSAALYPGFGLIAGRNATVACSLLCLTAWASWSTGGAGYFISFGNAGSYADMIRFKRNDAVSFIVEYQQHGGANTALAAVTYALPWTAPTAGQIVQFQATINADGSIDAFLDQMRARRTSVGTGPGFGGGNPPQAGGTAGGTGGAFLGAFSESGGNPGGAITPLYNTTTAQRNPNGAVSDIAIYNAALYPGQAVPTTPGNVLSVTPGTVPVGVALSYRHLGSLMNGNANAYTAFTKGKVGVVRFDKQLMSSPMEFSSTGAAVTAGRSTGSPLFWNWVVVHNDLDWGFGQAEGLQIDIDGVPQRMQDSHGGTNSYYTSSQLTSSLSPSQSFPAAMPNFNNTNTGSYTGNTVVLSAETTSTWGYAASDLYLETSAYCLTKGYPFSQITWGFWNEGNTNSFWPISHFVNASAAQAALWNAAVERILANDPNFAGMDLVSTTQYDATWIPAAMTAAVSAGHSAYALSTQPHDYQCMPWNFADFVVRAATTDAAAKGLPSTLSTDLGEDAWNFVWAPGFQSQYPSGVAKHNIPAAAVGAAYLFQRVIACAGSKAISGGGGVRQYIWGRPVETSVLGTTGDGFGANGMMTTQSAGFIPLAPLNVMSLLARMATDWPTATAEARTHAQTQWNGIPGVAHIATTLADGTLRVMMGRYRWDYTDTLTATVALPTAYATRTITQYVVDDLTASYYDSAATTAVVGTLAGSVGAAGTFSTALRGQGVVLFEIAPPTVSYVSLVPPTASLTGTQVQSFTASVGQTGGASTAITWSVILGTIDAGGNYTAPVQTTGVQTAYITATSVYDAAKIGAATAYIAASSSDGADGPRVNNIGLKRRFRSLPGTEGDEDPGSLVPRFIPLSAPGLMGKGPNTAPRLGTKTKSR